MALWAHQAAGVAFALERRGALLAMGLGSGKSLTALTAADEAGANKVLVMCPKAVVGVWRREVHKHFAGRWHVECLTVGTGLQKAETVRATLKSYQQIMIVVNYESAWRPGLAKMLGRPWDLIIHDECHRLKSPSSRAGRFARKLAPMARRVLALSATPCPHGPLDIWGQAMAIGDLSWGHSFTAFRARYAVITTAPGFPKIIGWQNQEEYRERFKAMAYEVRSSDVLDLPPVTEQVIPVDLGHATMRLYRRLERDLYAEVEAGTVTVANALSKLLRLQQLTGGALPLDEGGFHRDEAKAEALADVLEDITDPVVVFCRFTEDLAAVAAVAAKLGRAYGEVSGQRKDLTEHSLMPEHVQIMGVQIQSGGLGIDLTQASVGVFYSQGYSLGDHDQAKGRLHRPGQTKHVHFLHLIATGTVDEQVRQAIEEKRNVIETIVYGRAGKVRAAA